MPKMEWTDEKKDMLRKLVRSGKHNYTQIALLMGGYFEGRFTKNSISGAVNRYVKGKGKQPRINTTEKPKIKTPTDFKKDLYAVFDPSLADSKSTTLANIREGQCRFPFFHESKGAENRYCGRGVDTGVYCDHHAKICYVNSRELDIDNLARHG